MGWDVYSKVPQEVWSTKDPYNSREIFFLKKAWSWKKGSFLSFVLPVHGKRSESQTPFAFHLTHQCPRNSDLFFPATKESPTACGSLLVSLYITICVCIYSKILRYLLRKWSVVEKEDIFLVETILKVGRDTLGLWCSRTISQLKSVKGCAFKLIACFCP